MPLDPTLVAFGAVFVLGTYAVATLDDILHMSASRSFVYVWLLLAAGFAYLQSAAADPMLQMRFGLAVAVILLFHVSFIPLPFKLAIGDCIAMLPIIFLLPLTYVAIFVIGFLLVDQFLLRTWYVRIFGREKYPFMPALFIALSLSMIFMQRAGSLDLGALSGGVS